MSLKEKFYVVIILAGLTGVTSGSANAASVIDQTWAALTPKILGIQFSGIFQNLPSFHSPYYGVNSLRTNHGLGHGYTNCYDLYFGWQLTSSLQAYLDGEMVKGPQISKATGLGGFINGDAIRAGGGGLGTGAYIARLYLRYTYALSAETEMVERAMDQLPGAEHTSRVEIKFGKMAVTDDFDWNRYANNTHTQFLNWGFINNTAWDFAADTRGYDIGIVMAVVKPCWRLAVGSYLMPTQANGYKWDDHIGRASGNNLELTLKPNERGTVLRFLAYYNRARMGNYNGAIAYGSATSTTPDIALDEKLGRTKYGFGINLEQPLMDNGETGIFIRLGWNDGHNENFCYTEVDRHFSRGYR